MTPLKRLYIATTFSFGLMPYAKALELQSGTYFGYAATDHSSQGFDKASGTQFSFDAAAKLNPTLLLGIRSIGSGNQYKDLKFYKLGTGPFISLNFYENYHAFTALSLFNESGINGGGDRVFRAKGYQAQLGWLRTHHMTKRVSAGWGGFWGRFWGKAKRSPSNLGEDALFVRSNSHVGNQRGLQATLQILF